MQRNQVMIAAVLLLASCEKYTDATSPCFGKNGEPVVSRTATSLVAFSEEMVAKNCVFEPIGSGP